MSEKMANTKLLGTPPAVLTELERQRRFCLQVALAPAPCPGCGVGVNQIQAARLLLDDWDPDGTGPKPVFHCTNPRCGARLLEVVPFITSGPKYQWRIDPAWMEEMVAKARKGGGE